MKTKNIKIYLLAALVGALAVFGLTLLIYATFFQSFLEQYNDLSAAAIDLISRDGINLAAIVLANLAHGFLLATVIRWGKFYTPWRGATAGATVAFLTEVYFLFTQYAIFKTMSLPAAIFDTLMWTFINFFVGALVAWVLGRAAAK